ncbi:hypothetical protein [Desulfobacula sp.]|nr:hypothetical protein [Desulfobacula sp.]
MVTETELSPGQHKKLSQIVDKESGVVLNEKNAAFWLPDLPKE